MNTAPIVHNFERHTGLSIRSLNICSLPNKLSLLECELADKPDIVAIQETWLNTSHPDNEIGMEGYSIVRCDRPGRGGGGVAIYFSNRVGWSTSNINNNTQLEYICADVHVGRKTTRVCNVYRPPNSKVDWFDHFKNLLEVITDSNHDFIMIGDFNIDSLNAHESKQLNTILNMYDLQQHCDRPTRCHSNRCIDYFITKKSNNSPLLSLEIHTPISDHYQISAVIGHPPKQTKAQKTMWLYDQCDHDALNNAIINTDWSFIDNNASDINIIANEFMNTINNLFQTYIPSKTFLLRPCDKPWMNSEIRRLQRIRNRLHSRAKSIDTPDAWARYRQQKNLLNSTINRAKREHTKSIIDKLNSLDRSNADWWKVVRTAFGSSRDTIPALKSRDQVGTFFANDNKSKADLLNDYFVSVTDIGDENSSFPEQIPRTDARLQSIEVRVGDVVEAINSIPCNKAPGPDSITSFILKKTADAIAIPLCRLYNLSLKLGSFPNIWKHSTVIPVHKEGAKNDPTNYRPISLTSILSKIFEKTVLRYLLPYLLNNNLISSKQAGFLPKHSTSHQLIEICDVVVNNMKNGLATSIVFADISRAFDRLSHKGIYVKLNQYGLSRVLRDWIFSFLNDRQQRTCVGGVYSDSRTLKGGIGQGSVLGPIVFLLMINDLPSVLQNQTYLYADDTSVLFTHDPSDDITNIMNNEIARLQVWADTWKLDLNPSKTKFMTISSARNVTVASPMFRGQAIERVRSHQHLGLIINDRYTWHEHINNIIDQVSKRIGILRSLKHRLTRSCLRALYISHIRSKLEYCDVVWDGLCGDVLSLELEKLQRECIRIFTGLTAFCRLDHLYADSGLCSLEERRRIQRLVLLFKIIHNDAPPHLHGLLPVLLNNDNSRHGRHLMTFILDNPKLEKVRKSFIHLTCMQWNNLPTDVRTAPSLNTFKRLICIPTDPIPYLVELPRYPSILYNRLKYGCSVLNYDLYHANLVPDPRCECRLGDETLFHFLYDCPFYDTQRERLMFNLSNLGLINLSIPYLFHCDGNLESAVIPQVQSFIFHYIMSTNRF